MAAFKDSSVLRGITLRCRRPDTLQFRHNLRPGTGSNQVRSRLHEVSHLLRGLDPARGFDMNVRRGEPAKKSDLLRRCYPDRTTTSVLQVRYTRIEAKSHGAFLLLYIQKRKFKHDFYRNFAGSPHHSADIVRIFLFHTGQEETDIRHEINFLCSVLD
jgi:hypothetical protein